MIFDWEQYANIDKFEQFMLSSVNYLLPNNRIDHSIPRGAVTTMRCHILISSDTCTDIYIPNQIEHQGIEIR